MESSVLERVLVISDIHGRFETIHHIVHKFSDNDDEPITAIYCLGDFLNEFVSIGQTSRYARIKERYFDLFQLLSDITPRIFYVSGNHDPIPEVSPLIIDVPNAELVNVHAEVLPVVVQDSCQYLIAGLCGSIDNHITKWNGYPFSKESELAEVLQTQTDLESDAIYLSHMGPTGVDTTVYDSNSRLGPVNSGSDSIRSFLESEVAQQKIKLFVHGHTHPSRGLSRIGSIPIVNPGPVKDGYYAVVEFTIDGKEEGLSLRDVRFGRLNLSH